MISIEKLEVNKIIGLSLDDLKNESVMSRILEMAEDDQYEAEPMAARDFYESIEELLVKYGGQINGTDIYRRLYTVKTKLFWQSLPAMDKKLKQACLQSNVVYALKNQIEVASYIMSYLDLYEYGVGPDNEERQMFLFSFTRNEEALGTQPIKLKTGETVRNTVGSWIKDFLSYTDPNSHITGESYELTQYMYSSPNVKGLNPTDKELLTQILNIYNLLKHPKYIPVIEKEEVPAPPKPQVAPVAVRPVRTENTIAPTPAPGLDLTAFEKKLAQVSAPVIPPPAPVAIEHGADLEVLKRRMETQAKPAAPIKARNSQVDAMVAEIKREVATPELPAHSEPRRVVEAVKPIPKPAPIPAKPATPKPVAQVKSPAPVKRAFTPAIPLDDIRTMDDLKKVELRHLRGSSVDQQKELLKNKIIELARANRVIPYYALTAFEQSPLFGAYMNHGHSLFSGQQASSDLTKEEFEAIADIRRDVQKS